MHDGIVAADAASGERTRSLRGSRALAGASVVQLARCPPLVQARPTLFVPRVPATGCRVDLPSWTASWSSPLSCSCGLRGR